MLTKKSVTITVPPPLCWILYELNRKWFSEIIGNASHFIICTSGTTASNLRSPRNLLDGDRIYFFKQQTKWLVWNLFKVSPVNSLHETGESAFYQVSPSVSVRNTTNRLKIDSFCYSATVGPWCISVSVPHRSLLICRRLLCRRYASFTNHANSCLWLQERTVTDQHEAQTRSLSPWFMLS